MQILLTTSKEPLNGAEVQLLIESLVLAIHYCDDLSKDTSKHRDIRAIASYDRRNYQHMLDRLRA